MSQLFDWAVLTLPGFVDDALLRQKSVLGKGLRNCGNFA